MHTVANSTKCFSVAVVVGCCWLGQKAKCVSVSRVRMNGWRPENQNHIKIRNNSDKQTKFSSFTLLGMSSNTKFSLIVFEWKCIEDEKRKKKRKKVDTKIL